MEYYLRLEIRLLKKYVLIGILVIMFALLISAFTWISNNRSNQLAVQKPFSPVTERDNSSLGRKAGSRVGSTAADNGTQGDSASAQLSSSSATLVSQQYQYAVNYPTLVPSQYEYNVVYPAPVERQYEYR